MDFKQKLLDYFALDESAFNEMSKPIEEIKLLDPNSIESMAKIKERIFRAIENKEKILVYGDYDCDGVSATTIMVKTFEKLGYPVSYYIPIRYSDGYGLNVKNVIKIKEAGFNLIITVDNGIAQDEAIKKANELNMDVIVVDHHEAPEVPVPAYAVIHPIVSHISDIYGSGGYMALFLSAGLLGYYDDYLVTIGGMSVISDMMELKGYNRDVVRLAVNNLKKHQYKALISLTDSPIITEKTFGLEIAPKINAIGRLVEDKNINLLVKYLISENPDEIYKISCWIKNNNELRKTLTKEAVENLPKDEIEGDGIVLKLDIKEGLLGLIANRLLNEKNVPVIILTEDSTDKTFLKGSIRSKEGFNVQKAFESLSKYMVAGGGHAMAGGATIKAEDFENFKHDFIELCKEHKLTKVEPPSVELSILDVNFQNYEILREFAPFGVGFPEPVFSIRNLPTKSLQFISFGKHISTPISINSKLLGFNFPESDVKSHQIIDVFGNLNMSSFRDKLTLEFRISDFIAK
ncbi:MAG: DHH family phosphoesterase [Firmicutes bacterium]|nr:DHH family phosphoesterase [Candidatus Fiminaster equi]